LAPNQNYDAALAPQEIKKSNTAVGVGPAYEGTLEVLGTEVGYKATFGAELVVKQTTTLLERLIFGKITATHQSAGSRVASFSINSDGTTNVDIDLDIAGIWELSISDISFSTAMKHLFTVAPTLTAGLELINPDYESECTGYTKGLCEKGRELLSKKIKESNEKLSFKKDDFVDFSTDEITAAKLHYISSNSFDSFLINVGDMPTPPVPPIDPNNPTAVPEPSTLAIFALGIMGLASRRFRKQ
jgi:hypothetical protein